MDERPEGDNVAMTSELLGRRGVVENAIEIEARPEAVFDYCTTSFANLSGFRSYSKSRSSRPVRSG